MNKVVSIVFIFILSILVIGLTGFLIFLLRNNQNINFNFNFSVPTYSEKLIDSREFDTIEDMVIDVTVGDILVEESNEDKISVELYSDYKREHSIEEKDNKIYVVLRDEKNNYSFGKKVDRVIVKIPSSYDHTIDSKLVTGDLDVGSFENMKLVFNGKTADVDINRVNSLQFTVNTGDIEIEDIRSLSGKVTTGDVEVTNVESLDVSFTTGDIELTNVSRELHINGITGDVKIENATIKKNSSISLTTGDVKVTSLKGAYIEADTSVGDTKVKNNDRKLETEIKVSVNVGDIKINQ